MQEKLHQMRSDLKTLASLTIHNSRHSSLAVTATEEAMMFVGNTLKELGSDNPYPDSMNPNSPKIEKFYEHPGCSPLNVPADWKEMDNTSRIKWIRQTLQSISDNLKQIAIDSQNHIDDFACLMLTQAIICTTRAKNWNGMVLGDIRDNQLAQ